MPTFMDRHNAPDATLGDIAEAHRLDLEAQEAHGVRFLSYWFDPDHGLAFCLVDAPDSEALMKVHAAAHGAIPAEILEVDVDEVVAYLGQASEPAPDSPEFEGHRPDSAFRTLMFTDLVDSTTLSIHLGDAKAIDLLEQHDQAISNAVGPENGRIVKHTGDGFLISFDRIDAALRAAVRIQREVSAISELLSVKVGINPGNPVERGDDLFGLTVQMAARVCGLADGGQILVSGIVLELCTDPDLRKCFIDRGRMAAKGLGVLQVYELPWRE